jgi:pimeloyl-ACP methyl ester carboxylesterase
MPDVSPTIILVHGALTDASVWNGVTHRLQDRGYTVLAPAMPLRSLAADADYLSAFLNTIDASVVLAGHSC